MIAVLIRLKRCRVRLIPYNFYYFDGGGGGGDEEYNNIIILLYIRSVYYIIYCPPRGNRSHYYTYIIIIIVNCYYFPVAPAARSFFLIFIISFSLHNIHLCFPRVLPAFPPAAYIATLVRTVDYYTAPIIHTLYHGCIRHTQHHRHATCVTADEHNMYAEYTILHRPKSRDSTRVSYGRTRSHTRKRYSHRRSWNLKPPCWACLLIRKREFVTTVEINPRDCFLILVAFYA